MVGLFQALFCVLVFNVGAASSLADPYQAPRIASGQPDLQGVWTTLSLRQLERPPRYKHLFATDADVAALDERLKAKQESKPHLSGQAPNPPHDPSDVGQEKTEFADANTKLMKLDGHFRTSIILSPKDGRLPYTALGQKCAAQGDDTGLANPENRSVSERCLSAPNGMVGPPMLSGSDNSNIQIVQTPGDIAIFSEQIHDVRVVRIGDHHPVHQTHPWMGDSIGWWEGDTLVIETVDQNPLSAPRAVGARLLWVSPAAMVTERLTRVSSSQILYAFSIVDPMIYTQP